jgi:DNA-binding IclR family transcriptional regulator
MMNDRSSIANDEERSALSRGLDVLEALAGRADGLPLGEIARKLAMSKSGTHGVLATLARRRFVERMAGGVYRLGPQAWLIANGMPGAQLSRLAQPAMERLVAETGEAAILGVLTGFDVVYTAGVAGPQPVRVHAEVGDRIPANCTSTGLCLLAFRQPGYVDSHLPARLGAATTSTICDPDALRRELRRIHARGYAINRGGWRADVGGIAAPVLGGDGTALAGLCVAVPLYRMTKAWLARVVPATRAAADDIAAQFNRRMPTPIGALAS